MKLQQHSVTFGAIRGKAIANGKPARIHRINIPDGQQLEVSGTNKKWFTLSNQKDTKFTKVTIDTVDGNSTLKLTQNGNVEVKHIAPAGRVIMESGAGALIRKLAGKLFMRDESVAKIAFALAENNDGFTIQQNGRSRSVIEKAKGIQATAGQRSSKINLLDNSVMTSSVSIYNTIINLKGYANLQANLIHNSSIAQQDQAPSTIKELSRSDMTLLGYATTEIPKTIISTVTLLNKAFAKFGLFNGVINQHSGASYKADKIVDTAFCDRALKKPEPKSA